MKNDYKANTNNNLFICEHKGALLFNSAYKNGIIDVQSISGLWYGFRSVRVAKINITKGLK
jgi:hypothetical protein